MMRKPLSLFSKPGWPAAAVCFLLSSLTPGLRAESYPWPENERLAYRLLWPSGLELGEASINVRAEDGGLHLSATVEGVLPQNRIQYSFSSGATAELCSVRFRQQIRRGSLSWEETTEFDAENGTATRTRDGVSQEMPAPKCARDPLAYLFYLRRQLAAGQRPATDTLFLGGAVPLRIEALVPEKIKLGQTVATGDRYLITYRGAIQEGFVEIWVEPGGAHAPVGIRLPLPLATFAAELK